MVHENTRRPATSIRDRTSRQQAIRVVGHRRRTGARVLHAVTGALLVSSVALLGHALRAEAGSDLSHSVPSEVDVSVLPAEMQHALGAASTAPIRQGGDATNVAALPVERASAAPSSDPLRPVGWYQLAASEYGVSAQLLEALHQVESNASPDACIANLEGSGATGPFQFKAATFATFGVDANHDGVTDVCAFSDSLFSAARYLRAIGADHDPASETSRRALTRYGTDAERVVSLALAYQERDGLIALAPAATLE